MTLLNKNTTLRGCTFRGFRGFDGGVILTAHNRLLVDGCRFDDNRAFGGGDGGAHDTGGGGAIFGVGATIRLLGPSTVPPHPTYNTAPSHLARHSAAVYYRRNCDSAMAFFHRAAPQHGDTFSQRPVAAPPTKCDDESRSHHCQCQTPNSHGAGFTRWWSPAAHCLFLDWPPARPLAFWRRAQALTSAATSRPTHRRTCTLSNPSARPAATTAAR